MDKLNYVIMNGENVLAHVYENEETKWRTLVVLDKLDFNRTIEIVKRKDNGDWEKLLETDALFSMLTNLLPY